MEVLENKKRKSLDGQGRNSSNSSTIGLDDFGTGLDKEQEDEILRMVDELEQALEFREFEEVAWSLLISRN